MSAFTEAAAFVTRFQKDAPLNVENIAAVLGVNVWESAQLPEGIAGKLKLDQENGGPSGFSIIVRAQDPLMRKRFTVAHEIAHYLLHRTFFTGKFAEIVDDALYRSTLSTEVEIEADALAAEILMPKHLLGRYRASGLGSDELAEKFQVPREAMRIRLNAVEQLTRALA